MDSAGKPLGTPHGWSHAARRGYAGVANPPIRKGRFPRKGGFSAESTFDIPRSALGSCHWPFWSAIAAVSPLRAGGECQGSRVEGKREERGFVSGPRFGSGVGRGARRPRPQLVAKCSRRVFGCRPESMASRSGGTETPPTPNGDGPVFSLMGHPVHPVILSSGFLLRFTGSYCGKCIVDSPLWRSWLRRRLAGRWGVRSGAPAESDSARLSEAR